tara:strand:+ start:218 stop:490 length:273 start_codon:yes stop_codon:yes gene_type:complete
MTRNEIEWTQAVTQQLSIEIIEFVREQTDDDALALNALAGAVTVLAVRGEVDIRALLTAMRNDYQAMVRLKNGGVMVTDATEPYSTKGED